MGSLEGFPFKSFTFTEEYYFKAGKILWIFIYLPFFYIINTLWDLADFLIRMLQIYEMYPFFDFSERYTHFSNSPPPLFKIFVCYILFCTISRNPRAT